MKYSIVIPAKNEAQGLATLLPKLQSLDVLEIIVVNDGSTDRTAQVCKDNKVILITHQYSKGNGASIKTGVRQAQGDTVIFMDADGQHQAEDVLKLLEKLQEGYDLVVGARDQKSQAGVFRGIGNRFYNWFASLIVGHKIIDLTSGFRAVKKDKFIEFLYLFPNGFSYPTTSTMAFFRAGYSVAYVSVKMPARSGDSHLNIIKDGIKFLLIIFKVGTLYSPLKIFFPIAMIHLFLGFAYYGYTFLVSGRFTNMGVLLLTTGIVIFLIGLVSEQITNLLYKS